MGMSFSKKYQMMDKSILNPEVKDIMDALIGNVSYEGKNKNMNIILIIIYKELISKLDEEYKVKIKNIQEKLDAILNELAGDQKNNLIKLEKFRKL